MNFVYCHYFGAPAHCAGASFLHCKRYSTYTKAVPRKGIPDQHFEQVRNTLVGGLYHDIHVVPGEAT